MYVFISEICAHSTLRVIIFFLMIRPPPRSTRTDTLFPYTTLFRSIYDLNLDSPTYFYVLTYNGQDGNADRICGVASRRINVRIAEPIIMARVSGAIAANPAPSRGEYHLRSEEHTSELQSLMRISYAVFCLKKKKNIQE